MRIGIAIFSIFIGQYSFGATKTECFDGSISACTEIMNDYGRTSNKRGAIEFFNTACASQNLRVNCQIITTDKSETMKKALEVARVDGALFVMSGSKADKIYLMSSTK